MSTVHAPDRVPYDRYDRPLTFHLLATLVPWALWVPGAWFSHQDQAGPATLLALAGLFAPLGVVWWLTRHDRALQRDMWRRVWDFRRVHPVWTALAVGLMPGAVLVATGLSLFFGYSPEQFLWRGGATFGIGLVSGWTVLILAPVVEELAWHSYGTDTLRSRFSLFTTSLIFAVVWALWHAPLALFAGSSQEQTVAEGWIHALNFPVSMLPFVLLMNWIYVRGDRNITLTILFHLGANLSTQVLGTHPDTEVIATGVLLVITAVVLWHERELFFTPPTRQAGRSSSSLPAGPSSSTQIAPSGASASARMRAPISHSSTTVAGSPSSTRTIFSPDNPPRRAEFDQPSKSSPE